jgi:hypothetical protein
MTNATDTVRLPRTGVASPRADAAVDPRARHATQSLGQFAFISAQLVLLVWIIRAFQVEERAFLNLMGIATGGFLVHYWLPLRYKEPFWILLSLGCSSSCFWRAGCRTR